MTTQTGPAEEGPQRSEQSLTQRTSTSILWMTLQRWITRLVALATLMVLTRLLKPEDFGLAAAATTLIPILYVLSDVGFSTYIVQAAKVNRRTLNTAFWFSLLCGVVLAGAVALSAPLLGAILGVPEVAPLIQVMALSVVIVAFTSVPIALMRRRMAFRTLAVIEVTSSLLAQGVALASAFLGAGAWALVLQVLASQVVYGLWVWAVARWFPGRGFSWDTFRQMAGYGLPIVGSGLIGMTRSWLETVIIISGLGLREMGFIIIAQRLVLTAQELSVSALLPVATSAFARLKESPGRLRSAYLRATAISYAAVTPLMVFVAVSGAVIVPFLFGEDKAPSGDAVPALSVIVLVSVSWAIDQGLYLGTGRTLRWFVVVSASSVVALIVLWIAAQHGIAVLLTAWMAIAVAEAVARWFVVRPAIGATLWQTAAPQLGVLLPAAVSAAAGYGVLRLLDGQLAVVVLVVSGLVVLAVYLTVTRFGRPRTFADTVSMLPRKLAMLLQWAVPSAGREVAIRPGKEG